MDSKIDVIKLITQFHPGLVPPKYARFAFYRGGMLDQGGWLWSVLVGESWEVLSDCLALLEKNAALPRATPTIQSKETLPQAFTRILDERLFEALMGKTTEKLVCNDCGWTGRETQACGYCGNRELKNG